MNDIPRYLVLYYLDGVVHECITYFPDLLVEAFWAVGIYADAISTLFREQAI